MRRPKVRPGGWAWLGLTAYILAADTALIKKKKSTMSVVFGDALTHPARRWPVVAAWSVVTIHLFGNMLPGHDRLRRYDPIGGLARLIGETS